MASDIKGAAAYANFVGDLVVTSLSDGQIPSSLERLQNIDLDEARSILQAAGRPLPPRTQVNAFAVRWPDGRIALVDSGAGTAMGPGTGRLQESLALAGIAASDISEILLTHVHPDHSNGLSTVDGLAIFRNAELYVHADEFAHWHDDSYMRDAPPAQQEQNFLAARRQLAPYADRTILFAEGPLLPNITAISLPGHTPGHTGYLFSSGDKQLFIWGDTIHYEEIQFDRPDVTVVFDIDPLAATLSRRRALDLARAAGWQVAGMHHRFPGFRIA